MSEYDIEFKEFLYEFIPKYLKILLKKYRDARIELYKRDKHYHILIGFRHIEEGWINHIDKIEIIETDRKYLLILLGKALMSYKLLKAGKEILKPEHALIIYMPLPKDAREILGWRIGKGFMEVLISRGMLE